MIGRDASGELLERHALRTAGAPLTRAKAVVLAIHGRGSDAGSILTLADVLAMPDIAFLAPEAAGRAWYPQSFIAPLAANEPWLSRSLAQVASVLDSLAAAGVPDGRTALMGFSQGACLALETTIRRPRPYGAVIGLSGGYIGPMGEKRRSDARLDGASVFLGCSDIDSHIPLRRVKETTHLLSSMGAEVTERIYPGFGHAVNDDEIAESRKLLHRMTTE